MAVRRNKWREQSALQYSLLFRHLSSTNSVMTWKGADRRSSEGKDANAGLKPGLYKTKYNSAAI
jgi:hypothetical protein